MLIHVYISTLNYYNHHLLKLPRKALNLECGDSCIAVTFSWRGTMSSFLILQPRMVTSERRSSTFGLFQCRQYFQKINKLACIITSQNQNIIHSHFTERNVLPLLIYFTVKDACGTVYIKLLVSRIETDHDEFEIVCSSCVSS